MDLREWPLRGTPAWKRFEGILLERVSHCAIQVAYSSALLIVTRFRCTVTEPGVLDEQEQPLPAVVLPQGPPYVLHREGEQKTVHPGAVTFLNAGVCYRSSHPFGFGDHGRALVIRPDVLANIVASREPGAEDRPDAPFAVSTLPCPMALLWKAHVLLRLLVAGRQVDDPLLFEETALQLAAQLIGQAHVARGASPRAPRDAAARKLRDAVEAARQRLSERYTQKLGLDDIAGELGLSPFQLTRAFKRQVGVPLHQYLLRLRLAEALSRVADGERDLTDLALALGFSSHSHFTQTFRRRFGVTPSVVRRIASGRILDGLRSRLDAPPPGGSES
jgi:AraC-like DNA-binding protein